MAYEIDIEFAKREFFEENQSDDLDEMARAMAEWKAIELNLKAENQAVQKKERERLAQQAALPHSSGADDLRAQLQREQSAKRKEKDALKKQKSKRHESPSGKNDQHRLPRHHHHHGEPPQKDPEGHAGDELKKHKKSSKRLDRSEQHDHHHRGPQDTVLQDTARQHPENKMLSSPSKRLHPLDITPPIDYSGFTPSLELLAKQQKSVRPMSSDFDKDDDEALIPSKPMIVLSPSALKKLEAKRARKLAKRLALNRVPPKPADGFDTLWFACCSCRGLCKCFTGEQGKIDSMLEGINNPNRTVVKGWSSAINYSFNKFDSKWKDADVSSNNTSLDDNMKGNSISTVSGTGSASGSSHRKSRRFAKKPHTNGAFIFPAVDNGDRAELLHKTLRSSQAPPVTTILRWRSPADNDELESFDNVVDTHQPFVLKKLHEVVTTFETEDPFQIALEQSSSAYLEDLHITSEVNKQAMIRKKNFLRNEKGTKDINIIEPKKPSKGKSNHSLPTKLLPIKFTVDSFFAGPDLNTDRSDNDSILSRKLLAQTNDTEHKKLEPLFEELPPPKPSKFDMDGLFSKHNE